MSTIITALLIVIGAICIPLIFILINKNKNRKLNKKYLNLFGQEGAKKGLSFSSQQLLRNKIIGLDGTKQTVLVFDLENAANTIYIPLTTVKNCSVEKKYDSILIGTQKNAKIEPHLKSIDLEFAFKNGNEPVSISFYNGDVNSIYEMSELKAKAETWESVLSKMIFKDLEKRA
jgi:hypothetical protein